MTAVEKSVTLWLDDTKVSHDTFGSIIAEGLGNVKKGKNKKKYAQPHKEIFKIVS